MSLRGAIDAIPLEAVLQLLADTGKTGRLLVRGEERAGMLAVSEGRLVSARSREETGPAALGEVFTIDRGEFGFAPTDRVQESDLFGDLEQLLDRAVAERDRIGGMRELIPDERMRFSLSARAAERAEIRLSADQWRALLAVDGHRDVVGIAQQLGIRRLAALDLLAGLVRAGMVDTMAPAADAGSDDHLPPREPLERSSTGEPVVLSGTTADFPLETVVQVLAHTRQTGRVEIKADFGTATLGLAEGRLVSARADEESGDLALGATFAVERADFIFVPTAEAPPADLRGDLDELLDRAAETRVRIAAIRELVPGERGRFVLSERAAQHPEIRLTPEEWRALLAVNGERDLGAIAGHLGMRRLPTMVVLADLIEGGLVDVVAEAPTAAAPLPEAPAPFEPAPVFEAPAAEPPAASEWEAPPAPSEAPAPSEWEAPAAEAEAAAPEAEAPLEETPADVPAEGADERLSAITSVVGPAEPAPPPETWPAEPVTELPAPPATWDEPVAEEAPSWEQPAEAPASWEQPAEAPPAWEETPPAEPEPVDPRLAAFGTPAATPPVADRPADAPPEPYVDPRLAAFGAPSEPVAEAPTWTAPAAETTAEPPPTAEPQVEERPASELVVDLEAEPQVEVPTAEPSPASDAARVAEAPAAPAPPAPKRGLFGLFGGKSRPAEAPSAPAPASAQARTRAGQLALFVNELLASYNSGRYGKGRIDDRMVGLLMRVDEQADPVDRPIPVKNDRLDVGSIDAAAVPERQSLPYLATLTRQVYDDAERALGKDKAKRGFRDTRERLFGKDLSLFQAPEIAPRVPKV